MNFMKSLTSLVAKNHRCWAPPGLVPGGDSSRVQVWAPCGAQAQRRSVCVWGGVPAPLASAEISGQIGGGASSQLGLQVIRGPHDGSQGAFRGLQEGRMLAGAERTALMPTPCASRRGAAPAGSPARSPALSRSSA